MKSTLPLAFFAVCSVSSAGCSDDSSPRASDAGQSASTDAARGNPPPTEPDASVDAGSAPPAAKDAAAPKDAAPPISTGDGAAPDGFWDTSDIPAAKNVMTFKFLNRTNGKFSDAQVFWSFKNGNIAETHSIAEAPTYDMPANASGRMYFYLCAAGDPTNCTGDPTKSKYYDFIEHTIGPTRYDGNTTRVDAFGLKIAMRMHCKDGFDVAVGEDYETFLEDRSVTFQKFIDEVPDEFKPLAMPPHAPFRIVEPGAEGFNMGGKYASYYSSVIDQIWSANGITMAKAGPNGSGLAAFPDLSAAIFRHVGTTAGSFSADGKLLNKNLWKDATTFYPSAPADYYAKFWHTHALGGKAYGFPYDDVGGYSSYISHDDPEYMLVAIGW